jgi:hypothetical protein
MKAYTLRLDENRAKILKHLSVEEERSIREILIEMLDIYIEAHKETLEILSKKEWIGSIRRAEEDVAKKYLISHKKANKILNVED